MTIGYFGYNFSENKILGGTSKIWGVFIRSLKISKKKKPTSTSIYAVIILLILLRNVSFFSVIEVYVFADGYPRRISRKIIHASGFGNVKN